MPGQLTQKFGEAMRRHRLKREIVSTQIANDLVNHMGITFVQRLKESTGMSAASFAGAYVIVRDLFRLPRWWQKIEALDYQVPAELQLMDELMRLGRRATRWFLRSRRENLDAARDVGHFAPRVAELAGRLDELLEGPAREQWLDRHESLVEAGVPQELARWNCPGACCSSPHCRWRTTGRPWPARRSATIWTGNSGRSPSSCCR